MKPNYEHISGKIFYQWLVAAFFLLLVSMLLGCNSAYVHTEREAERRHASLFTTDIPEFISSGTTNEYTLWFSAETDSVDLTFWFIKDWDRASRAPFRLNEQRIYRNQPTRPTWRVKVPLAPTQRGLFIMKVTGYANDITYTHEYRFEIL